MRTSDRILRQVRRALAVVFILSGLASLVFAALALHAIPLLALDFAVPRSEQLGLLAASASAAALVLLCIDAARERILQRAGLWLDHTLAQHTLLNGSRHAAPLNALKSDAAAIARVRDALLDRAAMPALEAPWALALIAVLVLLHPLLGAIGALAMALLLLVAIVQAAPVTRLDQQRLRAADRVSMWWHGLPAAPLTVESAQNWERVNTPHVAAAYMLDRRVLLLRDLARIVRVVALLAAIGLGVWLVSRQDLTLGALVAGLLLLARLLLPFERLLAGLRQVRRAMLDYRRLASRPDPRAAHLAYATADASHIPMPAFTAPIPRLHIGGPVALGFGAALLLLAGGFGAVTLLPPQQIAALTGDARLASQAVAVRHAKGGVAAHLHVARGAEVKAGDVLVSLDTTALDRQIAALRNEAEVARKELDVVGREATALAALSPAAPNDTIDPGATVAEIATGERHDLAGRTAEPLLRTMHRMLRSLYQENAA